MDKDRIKGKAEDITGRAKRQVGEWTGDEKTQAEGAMDQAKGKARNAIGKVKDMGRDAADKIESERDKIENERRDENVKRDKDAA